MTAPFAQDELAALLTTAGLSTFTEPPERATPPMRYTVAGGDGGWLTPGQTMGSWRPAYRVICVSGKGTNETQLDELGVMVRDVIRALKRSRFTALSVDDPGEHPSGGLAAAVNIVTDLSRAEFEG